jgi:diacylglycerol kinase
MDSSLIVLKSVFTNLQNNSYKVENQKKPFSFKARIMSFKHAFIGIAEFFQTEHNALIHLVVAIAAIGIGIWLSVSRIEWVVIIFLIGIVFMAELFNTAIEKLGDSITKDYNQSIKKAKDFSAAAVFIAALTAVVIGLIIFIPRLIEKLEMFFKH